MRVSKVIFIALSALSFLTTGQSDCHAVTVSLQWGASTGATGYRVYYQANSSAQPFGGNGASQGSAPVDVSGQTSATISGLDPANAYYFAVTAYNEAGESSYSNVVSVPELASPTTSISYPASNASVSGTVAITASASDNVGVSSVGFYVNGVLQGTDTSTPYTCSWNTSSLAAGSYTLTARAYDAAGNVGESGAVTVTVVNDTTAPTVALTSPASGATLSGTVAIAASASDNVGVSRVEFYANGSLLSASNVAPYSYSWNTAGVSNGSYTLSARAYDSAGNVRNSSSVSVVVNNTAAVGGTTAVFGNSADANYTGTVEDTFLDLNSTANAGSATLNTYTWPASKPANAIMMKWNLSALPANAQIQSATLYLYMNGTGGDSLYEIPVHKVINKTPVLSNSNGYTYDGTNAWTPSSVPYNSIPLAQSDIGAAVDAPQIDTTYGYKSWNVTSMVQEWVANPAGNLGLVLNSSAKATSDSNRTFASSEAADAGQRPRLVVTYVLASDITAPSVVISSPASGATVSGTVSVSASASDSVGVSKVDFYLNGALVSTDSSSPYSYNWDTTTLSNGSYSLSAKAYDAAGNVGETGNTTVTVSNQVADTTAPTMSSFTMPTTSTSLAVAISALAASDAVGVTGYLVTESSTRPSATASGWSTGAPTSFTFSGTGTRTAYAWAKDAAGNVSNSLSRTVTITLPDTTAPTMSSFTMPTTSTSLAVAISALAATDAVGVTGYLVTESSTKPSATASGWSTGAPTSFTFSGTGTRTAYAWAKDAAGNVSNSLSRTVTITLPDTTAPTMSSFTMPTTSTSLAVAISALAATDAVGVTGYLVTESSTKPSATASGWSTGAPTSFTFSGTGTRTAYAWAKDAAGNVSNSLSRTVTITLPDTTAPTVAITSPSNGSVVKGTRTIYVSASDNVGVGKVEFYVNGVLRLTDSTASYEYTWNTRTVANGTCTLMARAYDAAGNVGQSTAITVTVRNR